MIFLDHSLTIASYEGVRVAINYDGTNAAVLARCDQIINDRGVVDATVGDQPRQRRHRQSRRSHHDHRLRPLHRERTTAAVVLRRKNADLFHHHGEGIDRRCNERVM